MRGRGCASNRAPGLRRRTPTASSAEVTGTGRILAASGLPLGAHGCCEPALLCDSNGCFWAACMAATGRMRLRPTSSPLHDVRRDFDARQANACRSGDTTGIFSQGRIDRKFSDESLTSNFRPAYSAAVRAQEHAKARAPAKGALHPHHSLRAISRPEVSRCRSPRAWWRDPG